MGNLHIYVGEVDHEYPDLGIVTPGQFVEFGDRPVPADGLWRAADAEEAAIHKDVVATNAKLHPPNPKRAG